MWPIIRHVLGQDIVKSRKPKPTKEGNIVSDYHNCEKSPINWCEYEPEDVCRDFCIHCGDPEERK